MFYMKRGYRMNKIFHKNQLLAMIVRGDDCQEGYNFVSPQEWELQVGYNNYGTDAKCAPHEHNVREHESKTNMEVLYIVKGKCELTLYGDNKPVEMVTLNAGDSAILVSGGHGLNFLEPSKIFEVRQGPYRNRETDKRFFNVKEFS